MKQTFYKILLLVVALAMIVVAIFLMVKTVTVTAPAEPEPDSVITTDVDSLANIYLQGGNSEDFDRAVDFLGLCLRENQIAEGIYNRDIMSIVSDSAHRTINEISVRLQGRWNYSDLASAINRLSELNNIKLAGSVTSAMDGSYVARLAELQQYMSEYRQCINLYSRRLGGNVSSQNARRIISEANAYLQQHQLLSRNIQISEKRDGIRSRLAREHYNYMENMIEAIPARRFNNDNEKRNYAGTIRTLINDYVSGIGSNGPYDNSGRNVEELRQRLQELLPIH